MRFSGSLGLQSHSPNFDCIWLGMCTQSGMHFCADGSGVCKARTVRRLSPSLQVDVELLKGARARPWDPSGTSVETDRFVLLQSE